MHIAFNRAKRIRSLNTFARAPPIGTPVCAEDIRAERFDEGRVDGGVVEDFVADSVGIEDERTAAFERARDGALSHTGSARDAD